MEEMTNIELRKLGLEELERKAEELRRELFQLRLRVATTPVKSFSSDQLKLKRAVARVLTHVRQKKLEQVVRNV